MVRVFELLTQYIPIICEILAGAGANVLRGVAGAGVLSLYDQYVYCVSLRMTSLIFTFCLDSRVSPSERCTQQVLDEACNEQDLSYSSAVPFFS